MEVAGLIQAGALIFIAFLTATAALLATYFLIGRRERADQRASPELAFLFDGDSLVDATRAGHRLLRYAGGRGSDMARLVAFLLPRYPGLDRMLRDCGKDDRLFLPSVDGLSRLVIEAKDRRLRLAVEDVRPEACDQPDRHSQAVLAQELDAHRTASEHTPVPVWRVTTGGRVAWANGAYWALAEQAGKTDAAVPGEAPILFPDLADLTLTPGASQRQRLSLPGQDRTQWFDVTARAAGGERVYTGVPADALVAAERNLREFIQTLTQTFAHLSVGLAIFDRKRELTLFNPALGDILGFDVDFLVARPSLIRFLDQLRERHMMPEPKDYKTWRQRMSELEAAAAERGHSETWPLPDGRTFRITGRPHPDGAVAFLFEDISAEISLNLEYRRELETGKAVIDTLDEAIAVFRADGGLSFANRAYRELWTPGETQALPATFVDASRQWQQGCFPSPVWGDARDFAHEMSGRSSWTAEVRRNNGRRLLCRFEPLPGGATMAGFLPLEQAGMMLAPATPEDRGTATASAAGG